MGNKRPLFEQDIIFHVYNHGNAEDNIFREEENYYYFLKRYAYYIYPVARTYTFCLLPNHFHLQVEIRSEETLRMFFQEQDKDLTGFRNLSGLVSKQFSNFLNAYTKAFNKKYNRKGKLSQNSLERKPVKNKAYHKNLITYIHQNPVHHGFVEDPEDWLFSSYSIILSKKSTQLERRKVLNLFGDKKRFAEFHRQNQEIDAEEFY